MWVLISDCFTPDDVFVPLDVARPDSDCDMITNDQSHI